jgi:hypothetical protein
VITAGQQTAVASGRAKRIMHKVDLKIPIRTKLGITAVEMQIRQDQMHSTAVKDTFSWPIKSSIDKYLKKRPHLAAIFALAGSNKRLCKQD